MISPGTLSSLLPTVVVAIIAAIGAGAAAYVWQRQRTVHSPRRLFRELCRAHHLHWRDRWLLWALARTQGLDQPAQLFVEFEQFDVSRLNPEMLSSLARLHALRDRLFGDESR